MCSLLYHCPLLCITLHDIAVALLFLLRIEYTLFCYFLLRMEYRMSQYCRRMPCISVAGSIAAVP